MAAADTDLGVQRSQMCGYRHVRAFVDMTRVAALAWLRRVVSGCPVPVMDFPRGQAFRLRAGAGAVFKSAKHTAVCEVGACMLCEVAPTVPPPAGNPTHLGHVLGDCTAHGAVRVAAWTVVAEKGAPLLGASGGAALRAVVTRAVAGYGDAVHNMMCLALGVPFADSYDWAALWYPAPPPVACRAYRVAVARCTSPLLVAVLRAVQHAVWALPGALVPARERFARGQALARDGADVAAGVLPPVSPAVSAMGAVAAGLAAGPAVAVVRDGSPGGGQFSAQSPAGSAVLRAAPGRR